MIDCVWLIRSYYRFIVLLYKICGRFLDGGAAVNSSWTMGHMRLMWANLHQKRLLALIHPPCFEMDDFRRSKKGVSWKRHALAHVLLHRVNSGVVVRDIEMISFISVGQFRPEKNHNMLIHSFDRFLKKVPEFRRVVRLKIVGSTRNDRDGAYLASLQKRVKDLECDDCVSFHVNVSRDTLHKMLDESAFGVHTMWDEHFGISVVEYILSGCIPIAHRSGGPLLDIVKDDKHIGFLCETEEEYANRYEHCVTRLASEQVRHMRLNGLEHIQKLFSSEAFECGMVDFLLIDDPRGEKKEKEKGK
jgi:alpha-1,2-mannosyltransferase